MFTKKTCFFLALILSAQINVSGQEKIKDTLSRNNNAGWFSLGGRSTISTFSDEGFGLGTGGQFRIQLSNKVNTDWFADYIMINDNIVRSEYIHIGWSVLFYPFEKFQFPSRKMQTFILAGHCFDYNQKTVITYPSVREDRWGSAVQVGVGIHFNLSKKFDITLMSQYMIHLTKELELEEFGGVYTIEQRPSNTLQGHLLTTVSLNYKLFKLWSK